MLARMQSKSNSHSLLVKMQSDTATLEDNLDVSYKTKHTLTTPSVLLGIYSNKLKIYGHTKIQVWIFISALFIIIKPWKQLRCPSVSECINKS